MAKKASISVTTPLKTQPKPSCAHLFTQITTTKFYTETTGQRAIVLASGGESGIFAVPGASDDFNKKTGDVLKMAIEQYRGTALPKLYDMITDRLVETGFSEKTLKFRACDLARMTGTDGTNADRVKKRFLEAARILYEFSFTAKTKDGRIDFRFIQDVQDVRGGFAVTMADKALELFASLPKVQHDTVLYALKDDAECAYSIGRWIEDFSIRHCKRDKDSLKEITFTMKAVMGGCAWIPETLKKSDEYCKRVPWLESQLNLLKGVGFCEWQWVDGRPACIDEESQKHIHVTFTHPRTALGPATDYFVQ